MRHRAAHGLAVVTGASSGIGAALARHLARRGQPVLAVARRAERLEALASGAGSLDAPIHPLALDVAEGGAAERVLEESHRLGGATWLVNNAGFGAYGAFAAQDAGQLAAMIRVNCEALVLLTRAFVGDLVRADHAVILNVASAAGFQPTPFLAVYGATKAFVLAFSEAIREELTRTRVTVTAFCPGRSRASPRGGAPRRGVSRPRMPRAQRSRPPIGAAPSPFQAG
jgi:short-subunit dehydrogenase